MPTASATSAFACWAAAGEIRIAGDAIVADTGEPDPVHPGAEEHPIADLPHDALVFLLGSRY
jgi:hypothetical protein